MKQRTLIMLLAGVFFINGCAKAPETVSRAQLKIDLSIIENQEVYTVTFAGLLGNENNDTAFLNVKGTVELFDPGAKKPAATFDFTLPEILPLTSAQHVPPGYVNVMVKKNFTDQEITSLLELLEIERDKLVSGEEGQTVRIDEKNMRFANLDYEKKNIITLLKEKI